MLLARQAATSEEVQLHLPVGLWFAIALVAVVVVCVLVRALDHGGRRDRALARLASARGWRYQSDDPAGIGDLRFSSFSGARGAHVTNVVTTDAGRGPVRGFDYSLLVERNVRRDDAFVEALADGLFDFTGEEPRTRREPTRRRSAAVVRVDAFCPALLATPANVFRRAVEAVGAPDLDFESVPFNRGWDVRCADERFAWLFLDASMIDLVLELGQGVTLETFGNYVLVTRDLLTSPEAVVSFVETVARVPEILNPLVRAEFPTVTEMESRHMVDAWRLRPDGRGGVY